MKKILKGKILLGKNFIDGFIVIDKDLIQEVIYNTDLSPKN